MRHYAYCLKVQDYLGYQGKTGELFLRKCNGVYCIYQAQNMGVVAKSFGHDS
jgi:hypothetical protein